MSNITRSSAGLVVRDDISLNNFVAANWEVPTGATVSIAGAQLQLSVASNVTAIARRKGLSALSSALVQVGTGPLTSGGAPGMAAQVGPDLADLLFSSTYTAVTATVPCGFAGNTRLSEYNSATLEGATVSATENFDRLSSRLGSLLVSPTEARFYNHTVPEEMVLALDTGESGDTGVILSSGTSNSVTVSRFVVCTGRYVSVSGLPAGAIVRVRKSDTTTVKEATESGGAAQLDFWKVALDGTAFDIAIFDADGVTLVDSFAPTGGVWPGDEYAYAAPAVVPPPVIVAPTAATVADQSTVVEWQYDDADSIVERASFSIELSPDGGSSWTTINSSVYGRTYTLDTSRLAAGSNYKVRLVTTDGGVQSAPAVSAAFTVAHTAKLKPPAASRNPMRLPTPPERYDARDQAETRRAIESWASRQDSRSDTQAADAASLRGTDLSTAAPTDAQVLTYDASSDKAVWETPDDSTINGVEVSAVAPADGEVLTFDQAANEAKWAALPDKIGGVEVDNSTVADGYVLTYDAALGKAVWKAPNITSIDGIPIQHGTPIRGYFLRYDDTIPAMVWATEGFA